MTNENRNEQKENSHDTAGQKSNEGRRGDSEKISAIKVEGYIKGIKFPAGKEDISNQAKSNKAPEDVMHALSRLEDKEYTSPTEVAKEMGQAG